MPTILVQDKNGAVMRHVIDKDEVSVGRLNNGNDIVLSAPNVSKRHARLVRDGGRTRIEDMQSTCGTFVNGVRVAQAQAVGIGDKIFIGDFILQLEPDTELELEAIEEEEDPRRATAPAPAQGGPRGAAARDQGRGAARAGMAGTQAPPDAPRASPQAQYAPTSALPVVTSGALSAVPSGAMAAMPSGALSAVPSGAMAVVPSGAVPMVAAGAARSPAQVEALYAGLASLTTAVEALYRVVMDERQKAPMSVRAAAAIEETRNALKRFRGQ